ncbi:MAG: preprotein translocase subunit SecG [Planctomycetota bacterium]|nr:preprotein translocase subunit SecG [Planctomycetota bacterium]MDA1114018.1 preprotein translocase subunit SecG [Planctomycetota bacterium]
MAFLLYTLFFISALLLILVILVQEGKGGGLGGALGGAGAETFGVRAGGVNKVTFILFGVFVLTALALHWTSDDANTGSVLDLNSAVELPTTPESGNGAAPVLPAGDNQ